MDSAYSFEPSDSEIKVTQLIGSTLLMPYYCKLVKSMELLHTDRVLDYCSGSGIISRQITKKVKNGRLVYTDVSGKWLKCASTKMKRYGYAEGIKIDNFNDRISGGEFDKIILHFSLHDFPKEYRPLIINQLAENLKPSGVLYIREPMNPSHGIQLYDIINLLENTKKLTYEYKSLSSRFMGDYIDINACLK